MPHRVDATGFLGAILKFLGSFRARGGFVLPFMRLLNTIVRRPLTVVECEVNPAGLHSEAKPSEIPKARSIPVR